MPKVEPRDAGEPIVRRTTTKRESNPWLWVAIVVGLVLVGVVAAWAGGLFNGAVTVPATQGMTLEGAKAELIKAGLKVGNVDSRPDPLIAKDLVVTTDPAAGFLARRGQAIDIVVSSGPDLVVVPKVVGSGEASAVTTLQGEGLTVDPMITRELNADYPAGVVFKCDPAAGTQQPRGTKVHIWVSQGPELVAVPMVTGMTQKDAEKALKTAGFKVDVTSQPDNEVAKGTVIDQDPAVDMQAPLGSIVTILVSTGPQQVTVPNVVGLSQSDAVGKIQALGLIESIQYLADANPEHTGKVQSQEPDGNLKALTGATVTIWVAKLP